jgi:hypothetical protein
MKGPGCRVAVPLVHLPAAFRNRDGPLARILSHQTVELIRVAGRHTHVVEHFQEFRMLVRNYDPMCGPATHTGRFSRNPPDLPQKRRAAVQPLPFQAGFLPGSCSHDRRLKNMSLRVIISLSRMTRRFSAFRSSARFSRVGTCNKSRVGKAMAGRGGP